MKKLSYVLSVLLIFVYVIPTAVAAPENFILLQDDFSGNEISPEGWTLSPEHPYLTQEICTDPENAGNSCMGLGLTVGSDKTNYALASAVTRQVVDSYYTATFNMRLNKGDITGYTEFAGVYLYYENENSFLALTWSRRYHTSGFERISIVKNGYASTSTVVDVRASGTWQTGWDFLSRSDYKIVRAGNKYSVYVNGADKPCISYTDTEERPLPGRFGFFNRSIYAQGSVLYADDLVITSEASAVSSMLLTSSGKVFDLMSEPTEVGALVDKIDIGFTYPAESAEISLCNSKGEIIPLELLSSDENGVSVRPLEKLAAEAVYFVGIDRLVTKDKDELLTIPKHGFETAASHYSLTAERRGQGVSVAVSTGENYERIYVYALAYKAGMLAEVSGAALTQQQPSALLGFVKPLDGCDGITVLAFGEAGFGRLLAEPFKIQ